MAKKNSKTPTPSNDGQQPASVDREGKPPVNRIFTAQGAWRQYEQARLLAQTDDVRLSAIRGMYDGFPPQDPRELEQQGLRDLPNVNFRQLQAKVDGYVATWTSVNVKGDRWFEVQLKRDNFQNATQWQTANQLVTDCFNKSIKYWDDDECQDGGHFLSVRAVCDTQMGIYGKGILHFCDDIDWRPEAVPNRKVLASSGTKINLHNCQALFIEKEYTVADLYAYSQAGGNWNEQALLNLIYMRVEKQWPGITGIVPTYAEWENLARNNSAMWLYEDFRPVTLVHCYFQEFNSAKAGDGITHCIIPREGTADKDFLYFNDRQFKRWTKVIVPFCDRCGPEGDWHGVKGLADMLFDTCLLSDEMRNLGARAAIVGSLPMFQAQDESDREKLKQIVFSPLGIMYPDVKLAELRINANLSGIIEVTQDADRLMNQNSRSYPQGEAVGGDSKTATQAVFDRQDQTSLTSLQIDWYRATGADRLGQEMYRRISASAKDYPESWPGGKTAKMFREKLESYGLAPEQYQAIDYVRAARTGATGNAALDVSKAGQVLTVASPGEGQNNARRELVAALYGWDRVPEFVQDEGSPQPELVTIGLENTTLQNAQFVDAFPFQNHELHLGQPDANGSGHFAVLEAARLAAMQIDDIGIERDLQDAIKLSKVMEVTIQHAARHVQFLVSLPFRQSIQQFDKQNKELAKVLNDYGQFIENFNKSIEKAMAKAQPQGGGESPEAQALMAKTQAEIQAMQMRTAAQIENDRIKTAVKEQSKMQTFASRTKMKEAEHAQKLGIQAEQAAIESEREKVLTEQQLITNNIKTAQEVAQTREKVRAKEKTE